MRTLDERHTRPDSRVARWIRDIKLATRIFFMIITYFTVGALVRARYRRRERRGEIYWLDEGKEETP